MAESGVGALICIPTYNERDNLEAIVAAVRASVPEAHILVIDDNSPDGTGAIADGLSSADAAIHVLHRTDKEGLGRAYEAGFRWALERDYGFVFEFDADFSHDPKYLPPFIAALRDGADCVVGSRRVKGGGVLNWGPHRRLLSWGGSVYAQIVLGVPVRDLTGGFNGFRRALLQTITERPCDHVGYGFQIELKYRAVKAGAVIQELPIVFPDRERGESKMSSAIFMEAFVGVWRMRLGGGR